MMQTETQKLKAKLKSLEKMLREERLETNRLKGEFADVRIRAVGPLGWLQGYATTVCTPTGDRIGELAEELKKLLNLEF